MFALCPCCHRVTTNHHNLTPSTFWNGKCRHLLFLIKTFLLTALPRPRPLFGFDYNFVCLFCWYYFNLRGAGETLNRKVRPDFSKVTEHFITVVKLNICMKTSSSVDEDLKKFKKDLFIFELVGFVCMFMFWNCF